MGGRFRAVKTKGAERAGRRGGCGPDTQPAHDGADLDPALTSNASQPDSFPEVDRPTVLPPMHLLAGGREQDRQDRRRLLLSDATGI
jgi:hypothetical protein